MRNKPLQLPATFVQGSVGQIILQVTPGIRQTPLTLYQVNQLGGMQFFKSIPMFDEELFCDYYTNPGHYQNKLLEMMARESTEGSHPFTHERITYILDTLDLAHTLLTMDYANNPIFIVHSKQDDLIAFGKKSENIREFLTSKVKTRGTNHAQSTH
jgi:hypothetical protein